MEETTSTNSLGMTAHWMAAVRARESERADGLFYDPWAQALAGEEGQSWVASRPAESVVPIVIRTRYFDDFVHGITHEQGVSQVVLLGAGLDTRAFRLDWSANTCVYELDQLPVLAYKEQVLRAANARPKCARESVGADICSDWGEALVHSGFNPQWPTLWLLEGFLFYLTEDVIVRILETITNLSEPGSWLGFDIINSTMLASPMTQKWVEMQANSGAPWIGTLDDPAAILAERGWRAALTQAGAEDANYGRWPYPVLPTMMPDLPHNWFVTARYEPHLSI